MLTTLRLFGAPQFTLDDTPVRFENRKAVALLSFCAASSQAHSRDRLAALLWPETDQALAALRTTLWEIRKKLDPELLQVSRQDVQLVLPRDSWCDIHEFLQLTQHSAAPGLEVMQRVELLQQAVDLYQDGFLSGFSLRDSAAFDEWQTAQTAYFQRLQARLLAELSDRYTEAGDLYAAIQTGERLRAMDVLAEAPVARLMRLYAENRQVQTALRLYQEYAALLQSELASAPEPALTTLYESLLRPAGPSLTGEHAPAPRMRPIVGAQAAGSIAAVIYRSPQTVLGRPRHFVGRRRLVERALGLLCQSEHVLLTGMGGIGKTATAADISARYIESSGQPVLWLETGFQSAREVFVALGRAFGQHLALQAAPNPAPLVLEMLAEHTGLLVLDNCWNASALFEVLGAVPHGMPVLVTSRQRMPLEGEILTVDRLGPEDARALLAYHARRELAAGEPLRTLLDLLGCHPFALEIAGKQLKAQPALAPAGLCARYARGTHEIAAPGGFADAERQSIDRVIGASVAEVSPQALAVLRAMGALAAPRISFELLALLMHQTPEALESVAAELEHASLAETGGEAQPWLRMHDLMYRYCRDLFRAGEGDLRPLVRAAGEYLRRHAADSGAAEREYANLLGALRAAQQTADDSAIIDMVSGLMWGYYAANGCSGELFQFLDQSVRLAHDRGPAGAETFGRLLVKRADVHSMQGRPEEAFQDEARALAAATTPLQRVSLMTRLAESAYALGRPEYAGYLEEAERQAREHGLHEPLCAVLVQRGMICSEQLGMGAAHGLFAEATELALQGAEPQRLFEALYNLSIAEIELGQLEAAEGHLRQAAALAEREHNGLWQGMCQSGLGRCLHLRGERAAAGEMLRAALAVYERVKLHSAAAWMRAFMDEHGYGREPGEGV